GAAAFLVAAVRRTSRRPEAARYRDRALPDRLCSGADVRRTIPPARCAAGFPGVWHDDGAAVVDPGADRRHRIDPVGIAEAGSARRGAWSCRRPVSLDLSG